MNIQVFETNNMTGRTPVKLVLHEVHKNPEDYNRNGIHWKREYSERNIDTIQGSPIVAEFLDDENDMPLGHGDPYIDEEGDVFFKNSVVVGVFDKGFIEDLEINGEMKTVVVGEGHLFDQRFPKFVDWIREANEVSTVKSSVEIGAKSPNKKITYEGGWKEKGRIPMDYEYTGHAILSETPADESAVLLEINKFKEESSMSKDNTQLISELNEKVETRNTEINELKQEVEEKEGKLSEVNADLEKKSNELNTTVEALKEEKEKVEKYETELNELRAYKKEQEDKELQSELNTKLASYTDEEKEVVKEKIETFSNEPSKELMNEIVSEINSSIAQSIIDSRKNENKNKSETNSEKTEDIFGDVQDVSSETNSIEDLL